MTPEPDNEREAFECVRLLYTSLVFCLTDQIERDSQAYDVSREFFNFLKSWEAKLKR